MKNQKRLLGIAACCALAAIFTALSQAATPKLPDAIEMSVRKAFPNARIDEVLHERVIVEITEVTVIEGGKEYDLTLSRDGIILSIGHEIATDELPTVVRDAAQKAAGTGKLQVAEEVKVMAELRAVPIGEPRIEYETNFRDKNKTQEMTLSEDGTVLRTAKNLKVD